MSKLKKIVVRIPIIGYGLRWLFALALLPRHILALKHAVNRDEGSIKSLEEGLLRANRQIIELEERLDEVRTKKS